VLSDDRQFYGLTARVHRGRGKLRLRG
jgi:hypothetical protein